MKMCVATLGDYNSEMAEDAMQDFYSSYNLKNGLDLILTNKSRCFQYTSVIETGLSDFHRLTVTIRKTSFQKLGPKIINYGAYKYFDNEEFKKDLLV